MAAQPVSAADVQRFYRAGAFGLRALQDRGIGAERFSADASARWKAFRGELTDSHRLDLLLRDGAAMYPLAFAARAVFELAGLARDEPFGPEWASLAPGDAGRLLREVETKAATASASDASTLLGAIADVWAVRVAALEPGALDRIGAASRIVVAGGGAVIALAAHVAQRSDMDFGDQVLLVADAPGVRQLAGLAAALTGSRAAPRRIRSTDSAQAAAALGFARATACVVSEDAAESEATTARNVAAELGG